MAIEAIESSDNVAFKATDNVGNKLATYANASITGNNQRLYCIYDEEHLGFEKDPISSNQRMQAQDPLQEIDIGNGSVKRPTYISVNIDPSLKLKLKKDEVFHWGIDQQKAFDDIKAYLSNPPTLMPPIRNKEMKLYISASDTTIGSMLAQEDENGVEKAIYYLSRVLNDVETRYSVIEKLCLCLYFSCTKLKHYIKPVDVYVYSHFDIIKHMLLKPILHSRIGKWALALTEYLLTYKPLRAVKGQIVADFLAEHSHVPRIENQEANDLAQIASGYKMSKATFEELIEIKDKLISNSPVNDELSMPKHLGADEFNFQENFENFENENFNLQNVDLHVKSFVTEIFVIDNLSDTGWRKPIVKYLENPSGITDRKTKYRALSYTIIGNELFKKTPEGILLKCLSENEAFLAITNVHSVIKPWPFRDRALDLIGEIRPVSSKNQRFILVGIDYFTKWIEAVALPKVDQEAVISFIINHIIYRFGLPETITTDQGTVFVGQKMQNFANEAGFRLLTSAPYYAQANGQVEAANKIIIGLIKKYIAQKPKNWHNTLDQVLWACRNSPKESTNSTPFRLTYGHDVVLPVELMVQSIRVQRQMEIPREHYESLMMDELVDLDEERLQALDVLIRQKERVAKAYNEKIKYKTFNLGDLVWKVILPMDMRDRVFGKWSPHWEGPFKISQVLSNGAYEIQELTPEQRTVNMNGKYLKRYKPSLQEINIGTE
ncbi:protein NYNRIN [Trifolium repens]|nr:protein NYNRIN [Trifolium repens]